MTDCETFKQNCFDRVGGRRGREERRYVGFRCNIRLTLLPIYRDRDPTIDVFLGRGVHFDDRNIRASSSAVSNLLPSKVREVRPPILTVI